MSGGRAQQARCDERAARDLREREWGLSREDQMRATVSDWLATYERRKRFGLRCNKQMPAMDGEESRIATEALSTMHWSGLVTPDARQAAKAEIGRASSGYFKRGKVIYPRKTKNWRGAVVRELIERDGTDCWLCGKHMPENDRTIEHVLARSLGGTEDLGNLTLTHRDCNGMLGSLPVEEKLAMRQASIARAEALIAGQEN